ncbi:MAG: HD domain-containing protein [Candidatus Dormiibacterota bacterium]
MSGAATGSSPTASGSSWSCWTNAVSAAARSTSITGRRPEGADPSTYQHSGRVAEHAGAIARRLRFRPGEVELVELAARVHDIGKIRIPDAVLLQPAPLTNAERRVMETHARLGFEILSQSSRPRRDDQLQGLSRGEELGVGHGGAQEGRRHAVEPGGGGSGGLRAGCRS